MKKSPDQKHAVRRRRLGLTRRFEFLSLLALGLVFVRYSSGQDNVSPAPPVTPAPAYSESASFTPSEKELMAVHKLKRVNTAKTGSKGTTPPADSDEIVQLQVLAVDPTGKAVGGLHSADFTVFVDGTPAEIISVAVDQPQNVIFLIDASESLTYGLGGIVDLIKREIAFFSPDDRISIVSFNEAQKVLIESSNDAKALENALGKLKGGNGTSVYQTVINVAEKTIVASPRPPTVVLISDGVDTTSSVSAYKAMATVWRSQVQFYVLYIDSLAGDPITNSASNVSPVIRAILQQSRVTPAAAAAEGKAFVMELYRSTGGLGFIVDPKSPALAGFGPMLRSRYTVTIRRPAIVPSRLHDIKVRISRPSLSVVSKSILVD